MNAPATQPHSEKVTGAAVLSIDGVTRRYGSFAAVDGVSLEVAPGEIVALLGHSGSGKSTLLRLITGLERPNAGTIAVGGTLVSGNRAFVPPEERSVGMMFQDYALFPHLSVIENLKFGLAGADTRDADSRALAALDRIGLGGRARDYPHALSGGEQQRVALLRALLPSPRILLMDEPFSNLDRRTRDRIREETATILRESGTTAILVTHDPEDAMRIAGRILLMERGRIVRSGSAEELYRQPGSLLVARFFADFNEIEGVVRAGHVRTAVGSFRAPAFVEGARVVVCIRPHDPQLGPAPGALTGTVVSNAFIGDEVVVSLDVADLPRPLQVHAPTGTSVRIGQTVQFHVNDAAVLVLPAAG